MTASLDIRNSAFDISPARRLAIMNLAIRGIEALCDQPEAQLTTTQTESHRLLEALLHHALPA
jgi:hypothetical protein